MTEGVEPPLSEAEILEHFRPGSQTVVLSQADIERKALQAVPILGAESLPQPLRQAHAEIQQGSGMTRARFKQALKELE